MSPERPHVFYWVLDGHTPIPARDKEQWDDLLSQGDEPRRVALDHVELPGSDRVKISTVFIGLNMSLTAPPLLFESMVFGGPLNGHLRRYASWDEARRGHEVLKVEAVIEGKVFAATVRRQIESASKGRATSKGKQQ